MEQDKTSSVKQRTVHRPLADIPSFDTACSNIRLAPLMGLTGIRTHTHCNYQNIYIYTHIYIYACHICKHKQYVKKKTHNMHETCTNCSTCILYLFPVVLHDFPHDSPAAPRHTKLFRGPFWVSTSIWFKACSRLLGVLWTFWDYPLVNIPKKYWTWPFIVDLMIYP